MRHHGRKRKVCLNSNKAFTFVEVLTVLAVFTVLGGIISTILLTNWFGVDDRLTRANLWYEANEIIETITQDGRRSQVIDLVIASDSQTALFFDNPSEPPTVIYVMTPNGELSMTRRGLNSIVLTEHLDFSESQFEKDGNGLKFQLALNNGLSGRDAKLVTASEIYPRN